MTLNMVPNHEHDYIQIYESAIDDLSKTPGNQAAQHKAVLALARAGSLNFALAEYNRYGLSEIRNHEDIMALGARLSKDLYLISTGKTALEHARDAAAKYEKAFKDTQGYYSGINAATMALVADMPADIVIDRVYKILELLPATENLRAEDHYFIEATRAECFLILGETEKVKQALRKAIAFDPLNYTAHASTLKQFQLILDKRGQDQTWLVEFQPPQPMHYAGHIWPILAQTSYDLELKISDLIQLHDVGFGYGALAAGADVVIAEALLSEGVELNVILPTSVERFVEQSVRPFGQAWVPRFKSCLARARSCATLPDTGQDLNEAQTTLAGQMAMGQTILRGKHLGVAARQLLISDPSRKGSLTARHAEDWKETGLAQLSLDASQDIKLGLSRVTPSNPLSVLTKNSIGKRIETYPSFEQAIAKIIHPPVGEASMHSLHFDLPGAEEVLETLISKDLGSAILVSEAVAGYVALKHRQDYNVIFAGTLADKAGEPIRSYALQPLA